MCCSAGEWCCLQKLERRADGNDLNSEVRCRGASDLLTFEPDVTVQQAEPIDWFFSDQLLFIQRSETQRCHQRSAG